MVITRCEEGADLVSSNGGNGRIVAQEGLKLAEGVGVVSNGVRAEMAGVSMKQIALKGLGEGDLVENSPAPSICPM